VGTAVRNIVKGSRCLNRLSHLKVNIQFDIAEPEGPDIEDITHLGDDVSKQDVLDLARASLIDAMPEKCFYQQYHEGSRYQACEHHDAKGTRP
jgi:hypothetical protein